MTKRLDPDLKALRGAVRALQGSSTRRMLKANMGYLWDRFIAHPPAEDNSYFVETAELGRHRK